jgi:hypothetical protein
MLAFDVSIYRLPEKDPSGEVTRNEQLARGDYDDLLALWTVRAEPGCLGWIDDLVDQGKAEQLNGDGYPMLYVGETQAIIGAALGEVEVTDEIAKKFEECWDDEALVVTAWDLS